MFFSFARAHLKRGFCHCAFEKGKPHQTAASEVNQKSMSCGAIVRPQEMSLEVLGPDSRAINQFLKSLIALGR